MPPPELPTTASVSFLLTVKLRFFSTGVSSRYSKSTRSNLFDLVPGLMGKSYREAKKDAAQKKEIPTIMDDQFTLPAFLRRK